MLVDLKVILRSFASFKICSIHSSHSMNANPLLFPHPDCRSVCACVCVERVHTRMTSLSLSSSANAAHRSFPKLEQCNISSISMASSNALLGYQLGSWLRRCWCQKQILHYTEAAIREWERERTRTAAPTNSRSMCQRVIHLLRAHMLATRHTLQQEVATPPRSRHQVSLFLAFTL